MGLVSARGKALNIQTEHLANHTARLTVSVDAERLEFYKKQASSALAQKYNIPGFRKGKAPYNILVKYLGEGAIIEEAVELLGNEIYPKALAEANITPYAPGTMEDVKLDPLTYTFVVTLAPEVKLNNYRDVRVEFEKPEVTEEELEDVLKNIQREKAVSKAVEEEIEAHHYVVLDLHSHFSDGEDAPENEDADDENEDEDETPSVPYKGDEFLHFHDREFVVSDLDKQILNGFSQQVIGTKVNDTLTFELEVEPESARYSDVAGRKVMFDVTVKSAKDVQLAELTDALAQELTQDEDSPLQTMDELRVRVMENLQREAENKAESEYAEAVISQIIEQATFAYPELMVEERMDEMLNEFEQRLKQNNLSFDWYAQILGTTKEQMRAGYRADAEVSVKRSLVLGEVLVHEGVLLSAAEIDAEIENMLEVLNSPEEANNARKYLNQVEQRENIANRLLYSKVMRWFVDLGQGKIESNSASPSTPETPSEETTETTED